jgi:peptide/nickel transport system permease protein
VPPLLRLILLRVGLGCVTLLLVSLVVFAATQALPGDPARAILGKGAANKAVYEGLREELGLNRPLQEQYLSWLQGVMTGDLGDSIVNRGTSVATLLKPWVINSLYLLVITSLVSIPLSVLIGAMQAYWRDRPFDHVTNVTNLVLSALPEFVIGLVLVLLLATSVFHVLPAVSQVIIGTPIYSQAEILVLPVITLCLATMPYTCRMLRASTIGVLDSEFVMMADLKGLPNRLVLWRHALPNALGPTFQVIALNLAWLTGGIVVVEYVFNYPGIGTALVKAVANRDMPVVQALCMLIAAVYVVTNLAADIATILVNPRLRTGMR